MPDIYSYNVYLKCESASKVYDAHQSKVGGHEKSYYIEDFKRLVPSNDLKANEGYACQKRIEREWEPVPNDLPVRLEVTKNTKEQKGLFLLLPIHLLNKYCIFFGSVYLLSVCYDFTL